MGGLGQDDKPSGKRDEPMYTEAQVAVLLNEARAGAFAGVRSLVGTVRTQFSASEVVGKALDSLLSRLEGLAAVRVSATDVEERVHSASIKGYWRGKAEGLNYALEKLIGTPRIAAVASVGTRREMLMIDGEGYRDLSNAIVAERDRMQGAAQAAPATTDGKAVKSKLQVEFDMEYTPEVDGRWIADVVELGGGVMVYGDTWDDAEAKVKKLAKEVIISRFNGALKAQPQSAFAEPHARPAETASNAWRRAWAAAKKDLDAVVKREGFGASTTGVLYDWGKKDAPPYTPPERITIVKHHSNDTYGVEIDGKFAVGSLSKSTAEAVRTTLAEQYDKFPLGLTDASVAQVVLSTLNNLFVEGRGK